MLSSISYFLLHSSPSFIFIQHFNTWVFHIRLSTFSTLLLFLSATLFQLLLELIILFCIYHPSPLFQKRKNAVVQRHAHTETKYSDRSQARFQGDAVNHCESSTCSRGNSTSPRCYTVPRGLPSSKLKHLSRPTRLESNVTFFLLLSPGRLILLVRPSLVWFLPLPFVCTVDSFFPFSLPVLSLFLGSSSVVYEPQDFPGQLSGCSMIPTRSSAVHNNTSSYVY